MSGAYDLSKLGPNEFQNMVNFLALKTLGSGHSSFGPGPDGGRDGYFEGEAPYPSQTERWSGIWYLQSKFHAPHLSSNPQKWLQAEVAKEIQLFKGSQSTRAWPDNWIIATNIEPSGKPETGSFDVVRKMTRNAGAGKHINVAVWGGRKILDLLAQHEDVARSYGDFLTPGHLISALYDEFADRRASIEEIVRYFVVNQFQDQTFTKLDQAGSQADARPGVHELFIDLPFAVGEQYTGRQLLAELSVAAAQCQRYSLLRQLPDAWREWSRRPRRARVSLIKGGPGQGKSTIGQYLCQIHRAFILLEEDAPLVVQGILETARAVRAAAQLDGLWPASPRIPMQVELKEFAQWYSQRSDNQSRNVLSFLANRVTRKIDGEALPKTIKRALGLRSWIIVFDGLDEVPNDLKDVIAREVLSFVNETLVEKDADVLTICTSRPQGYSGQFAGLDGPVIDLKTLDVETAMRCAKPVLRFRRSEEEAQRSINTLELAIRSPSVAELMTTPLQSHIMAVVVRDGGKPPERRWQLFNQFYLVMKKRESSKNFANPRIAILLREEHLLKAVHNRLGFVLHARAERSEGAQTTLSREEFRQLVRDAVTQLVSDDVNRTVDDVMEATTERLVLVSTPESGEHVRFDIRQLQEFFAAEFLYDSVDPEELENRTEVLGADAHWREVMHFLLSALVAQRRPMELRVAVDVLRRLDEGTESDNNNLYPRRMARSALLASRLVSEGVLEEDQRQRQIVKALLEPLFGIFDFEHLGPLGRLSPTRTRHWLIQVLIDRLSTSVGRENVGSLYVLGTLLESESVQGETASVAFRNLPIGFQEEIFARWKPAAEVELRRPQFRKTAYAAVADWVVGIAVQILNSDAWWRYSSRSIRSLLQICRTAEPRCASLFTAVGVSAEVRVAVNKCIDMYDRDIPGKRAIDFGMVIGNPYEEDWINGKVPESLMKIDAATTAAESHGLFRLMLVCVWWAQDKDKAALQTLVEILDRGGLNRLSVLPPSLLALVPLQGQYSIKPCCVDHLRNIADETSAALVKRLQADAQLQPLSALMLKGKEESSAERWRKLALTAPGIAVNLAFNRFPLVGKPILVPELIEILESEPAIACRHILNWGRLLDSAPDLLRRIKDHVCTWVTAQSRVSFFSLDGIEPFRFEMPTDAPLLAVLAPALIRAYTPGRQDWATESVKTSFRDLLTQYNMEESMLRTYALSQENPAFVSAGALALYWMWQSDGGHRPQSTSHAPLDLPLEQSLYMRLVDDHNQGFLTRALVKGVLSYYADSDSDARDFATSLMERCLDGEGPRAELVELLEIWRERSSAPVHTRQVMQKWLGYSFDTPSYVRPQ